jgi:hypothetical protein
MSVLVGPLVWWTDGDSAAVEVDGQGHGPLYVKVTPKMPARSSTLKGEATDLLKGDPGSLLHRTALHCSGKQRLRGSRTTELHRGGRLPGPHDVRANDAWKSWKP